MAHTFKPHTVEFLEVAQDILRRAARDELLENAVQISRAAQIIGELLKTGDVKRLLPTETAVTAKAAVAPPAPAPELSHATEMDSASRIYRTASEDVARTSNMTAEQRVETFKRGVEAAQQYPKLVGTHDDITGNMLATGLSWLDSTNYSSHRQNVATLVGNLLDVVVAEHPILSSHVKWSHITGNLKRAVRGATLQGRKNKGLPPASIESMRHFLVANAIPAPQSAAAKIAAKKQERAAAAQRAATEKPTVKTVDVFSTYFHLPSLADYPIVETMDLDNARRAYRAVGSRIHAQGSVPRSQRMDSLRYGVLLAKKHPQLLREEVAVTSDILGTAIQRLYHFQYSALRHELGTIVTDMIDAARGTPIGLATTEAGKETISHIQQTLKAQENPRHFAVTPDFMTKLQTFAKREGIEVAAASVIAQLPAAKSALTPRVTTPTNDHAPTNGHKPNGAHINGTDTNGAPVSSSHTHSVRAAPVPAAPPPPSKPPAAPTAPVRAAQPVSKPLAPPAPIYIGNNGSREHIDPDKKRFDGSLPHDANAHYVFVSDVNRHIESLRAGTAHTLELRTIFERLEAVAEQNSPHLSERRIGRPLVAHILGAVKCLGEQPHLHLVDMRPRLLKVAGGLIESYPGIVENWGDAEMRFVKLSDDETESRDMRDVAAANVKICLDIKQRAAAKRPEPPHRNAAQPRNGSYF